jgi:hypothetical protein
MLEKLTTIVKWVSITVLLVAITWHSGANYRLPWGFVVCLGTTIVVMALPFVKERIKFAMTRARGRAGRAGEDGRLPSAWRR